MSIPCSITFRTTCATAVMILGPAAEPATSTGLSSRRKMIGLMALRGRLHEAMELTRPGTGSKSPIVLLRKTPVPGITTPHPKKASRDSVHDTALPLLSTVEK